MTQNCSSPVEFTLTPHSSSNPAKWQDEIGPGVSAIKHVLECYGGTPGNKAELYVAGMRFRLKDTVNTAQTICVCPNCNHTIKAKVELHQ